MYFYEVGKKYGLLTEWIMTGRGPKRIKSIENDLIFFIELETWAKETGRSDDIQWLRNQIESFFPMFREWKEKRDLNSNEIAGFKKQANGGNWK